MAPLALSVAAGTPFSTVEAMISTARLSLWIFTLDDLFDEAQVPRAELIERAEGYRALAHREIRCPTGDSLALALCEVRDDLASYPLFDALGTEWATALCGTIDGMLAEYRWSLAYANGASIREPSTELRRVRQQRSVQHRRTTAHVGRRDHGRRCLDARAPGTPAGDGAARIDLHPSGE